MTSTWSKQTAQSYTRHSQIYVLKIFFISIFKSTISEAVVEVYYSTTSRHSQINRQAFFSSKCSQNQRESTCWAEVQTRLGGFPLYKWFMICFRFVSRIFRLSGRSIFTVEHQSIKAWFSNNCKLNTLLASFVFF